MHHRPSQTECLAFLVDKCHVVRDVIYDSEEELLERERSGFTVDAAPREISFGQRAQHPRDVTAAEFNQAELFFQIALVVGQAGGVLLLVPAGKDWFFLGDNGRKSVRSNDLKVGQVRDDLQSRPFARDRTGVNLCLAHSSNRLADQLGA